MMSVTAVGAAPVLSERQKNYLLAGLLVVLVAVLAALLVSREPPRPTFRKLPLAYKLTQKRAIQLTRDQMNGTQPLQELELDIGQQLPLQFEPPTLRDIVLSMQEDATTRHFDGVCAMNYNIPVSVCFMPVLGSERNLVMYNLNTTGHSKGVTQAEETSMLCDQGLTKYGYERFKFVWVEFVDQNLEHHFLKLEGRMTRVVQHMAWLNRGVTVCDPLSAQQQADILFQVMEEFRPVK